MKIFITIAAVALIMLFIIYKALLGTSPDSGSNTVTPIDSVEDFGNSTIVDIPNDNEISKGNMLTTTDGRSLPVANFREAQGVESVGENMFHLDTRSYGIMFNETNSSFAIHLDAKPILQTRKEAVDTLAATLNVEPYELCNIKIYVGTTADIDEEYSGKNLGLGICGN